MIDKIYKGVVNALRKNFEDLEIYTDRVPQGFARPCFHVKIINVDNGVTTSDGKTYKTNFVVVYHPKNEQEPTAEICTALELLPFALEFIEESGEKYTARDMRTEIGWEYGTFFVSYKFKAHMTKVANLMEILKTVIEVNYGNVRGISGGNSGDHSGDHSGGNGDSGNP